jgi:hypothetical protein
LFYNYVTQLVHLEFWIIIPKSELPMWCWCVSIYVCMYVCKSYVMLCNIHIDIHIDIDLKLKPSFTKPTTRVTTEIRQRANSNGIFFRQAWWFPNVPQTGSYLSNFHFHIPKSIKLSLHICFNLASIFEFLLSFISNHMKDLGTISYYNYSCHCPLQFL